MECKECVHKIACILQSKDKDKCTEKIKEMCEYITSFDSYPIMNSWNNMNTASINVKIYKFVPNDLMDYAFEIIDDNAFCDYTLGDMIHEFHTETGYYIGLNGRSGGHAIIYSHQGKSIKGFDIDEYRYEHMTDSQSNIYEGPAPEGEDVYLNGEIDFSEVEETYSTLKLFEEKINNIKRAFIGECEYRKAKADDKKEVAVLNKG